MKDAAALGLALGLALLLGSVASANAQTSQPAAPPGTMVGQAIGNTLEVVYPNNGPTVTFNFEADGTFTAVFPGGVAGHGDYVADQRYVCWITKAPADFEPGRNVRCESNSAQGKTLGQSWTITDSYGDKPTITIRPRR